MTGRLQRALAVAAVVAGLGTLTAASSGLAQQDQALRAAVTPAPAGDRDDCPYRDRPARPEL